MTPRETRERKPREDMTRQAQIGLAKYFAVVSAIICVGALAAYWTNL